MGNSLIFPRLDLLQTSGATFYYPDTRFSSFLTTNLFNPEDMDGPDLLSLEGTARFLNPFRHKTFLDIDFGAAVDFDAAAFINLRNASQAAQVRLIADDTDLDRIVEVIAPTSVEASTNLTGPAATDVDDDPDGIPDGNEHTATSSGTATSVRLGFPTPTYTPRTGTDANSDGWQCFRVRAGSDGADPRDVTVYLHEGATQRAELGTFSAASTASGGTVMTYWWNASLLALGSGANVSLRVDGAGSAGESAVLMAALWYSAGTPSYDSDWVDPFPSSVLGWDSHPAPRNAYIVPSAGQSYRYVRFQLNDESNTDGYVDWARPEIGEAWQPAQGVVGSWSITPYGTGLLQTNRARSPFVRRARTFRRGAGGFMNLSQTEWEELHDLCMRKGGTEPVAFLPAVADTANFYRTAVYGMLPPQGAPEVQVQAAPTWRTTKQIMVDEYIPH